MILLIDNYDSFSYNLYQLIGSVEPEVKVIRNDDCTLKEIEAMQPEALILDEPTSQLDPIAASDFLNTVRKINRELGTTVLCCTPSYATYLGETIREMGLDPKKDLHLKAGCFGAEPWTEEMRARIEELL